MLNRWGVRYREVLLLLLLLLPVQAMAGRPGDIVTVAGQNIYDNAPATLARLALANGRGVARDGAGNLYISDSGHHRVRKVDAVTGMITTVVGNGSWGYSGDGGPATSASLNNPQRLAFDGAGNLFIVDYGNNRIRKVSPGGVISTVAGNGTTGYSGDGGPAVYASLNNPRGIALDASGNLYIADNGNHRVRKVTSGVITTVAGDGSTGFSDDVSATSTGCPFPYAVAVDGSGNLYVAHSSRVRRVDGQSGNISTVAGSAGNIMGISLVGNRLYLAEPYSGTVSRLDLVTGQRSTVAGVGGHGYYGDGGPATAAALSFPFDLCADPAENLYIYDSGNHRIRRVDQGSGRIDTVAGSGTVGDGAAATDASLADPVRVVADAAGNIYIADVDNGRIRRVDAATGLIGTVAGNGVVNAITGDYGPAVDAAIGTVTDLALDSGGNLYIAGSNRVRKVDAAGVIYPYAGYGPFGHSGDGGPATWAGLVANSLAVDLYDNIYIGDNTNHRIRKVDAQTGIISTVAGSGANEFSGDGGDAVNAGLMRPFSLAVDRFNNLYFGDLSTYRIRKIDSAGKISTVAGNGISGHSGDGGPAVNASIIPRGIGTDHQGNLYTVGGGRWADGVQAVRKIDTATGIISSIAGSSVSGFSGDGGPALNATFSRPSGVFLDASGNLYVADRGNGRIRKIFAGIADTTAPTVAVSPAGGTYAAAQRVTLTASEPSVIYYTTDGSDPVANPARLSLDTSGQVDVASAVVLRYVAKDRSGNLGQVASQSYNITYQAVLDPEYQSISEVVFTDVTPAIEVADVSLTSRALTYAGTGEFGGSNTMTNHRVVQILTGSYAGWEYGTGSYDFSGYRGVDYFVKYKNQVWKVLLGDIHGVMVTEEGNLHANKLYITSINGVASPRVVQLSESSRQTAPGVLHQNAPLTVQLRTLTGTLSGYANTTFQGASPVLGTSVGGVSDSISIGSHSTADGTPVRAFVYHNGATVAGLYQGGIFGLMNRVSGQSTVEHILARDPGVSAGNTHAASVKEDGSLWSWGNNGYGQLGDGTSGISSNMPRSVLSGMLRVSAGGKHTVAIDGNGRLLAWGDNSAGALGSGDWTSSASPRPVNTPANYFTAVSAGPGYSLALDLKGKAWSWGDNGWGQLGNGSLAPALVPQPVQTPEGVVLSVAAGERHALALMNDFTVWSWGNNEQGQLGGHQVGYTPVPVKVQLQGPAFAIAAGGGHSLALASNGTVWAWGSNGRGQLGNGTTADTEIPVQVTGLSGVVAVAAGYDHSLALKGDGTVWAWGGNGRGQLGNNDAMKLDSAFPVQVKDLSGIPLLGVRSIAAGNSFSLAAAGDGKLHSFGANDFRQLAATGLSERYYQVPARMNVSDTVPPTLAAEPPGGSYSGAVTVTITSSESSNGAIYYTLDGSDPFRSSTRKAFSKGSSVSFQIAATTTLRYAGVDGGANPSRQYVEQYSFPNAPSIVGTPATTVSAGTPYSFAPAGGVAGGTLTYSIVNKPAWASFNGATGTLTGTPTLTDLGTYPGIEITVSANGLAASLPPFPITVTAPQLQGATTFVTINQGAQTTGSTAVTLNLGCGLGERCAFMQFSNDNLVWSAPEPFSTTKQWALPSEDGLKTVYVNFLDANGAPSNTYFNNIVFKGSTTPSGSYLFAGKWGTGAGTGNSPDGSFFLPNAVAWSLKDAALYVADGQNCRVQKFDANLDFLGKWGGCGYGDGQFVALSGVAVDSAGNVYVADRNRIQKFAPDGALVTKWNGTGTGVRMIAVGPDDTVYLTSANTVQLFDHNGRFLTQWQVNESVTGITADSGGNVYLRGYNYVWLYDAAGNLRGSWPVPAGENLTGGSSASGLAVDPVTGKVAVADVHQSQVRFFTGTQSESDPGTELPAWGSYGPGSGMLKKPQAVAFDGAGNLYVADTGNQRVVKLTPGGATLSRGTADAADGGFSLPVRVATDPASGNLVVLDQLNDRFQLFSPQGEFLGKWGGTGNAGDRFVLPLDAVPDGRGNVYVLDGGNQRVQKVELATGSVTLSFWFEQIVSPRRLAIDRDGNLYLLQARQVTKFSPGGAFLATWNSYPASATNWFYGADIAIDPSGPSDVICVADSSNRRVLRFDTAGNPLGVVASGELSSISAITVDREGFLYSFDNSVGAIKKFDPQGNLVAGWGNKASVLDGSMKFVQGMAVDASGAVYVADSHNNRIQKFVPAAIPNGSVSINSGGSTTLSRSVDLTLFGQTTTGYIQWMRFSNDNMNWSAWEPYSTTKNGWLLPDREGTNYVYTQFRNSWGTVSSTIRSAIALKYQFFTVVTAPVDSYTPVSVTPSADASLNVTFQSVISTQANSGVRVTAAVTPPPPPAELKVYNSQVYEISAAGITFAGTPEVCLAFRPSAVASPDNMKIMHHNGSAWQDITTKRSYDLASDTGKVCGNTTSFSPFMLAELQTPVDGSCGVADGGTFAAAPVDYLCAAGTPSVLYGNGPWNWSCSGKNGGSAASCSAAKLAYVSAPVTSATPPGGNFTGNALLVTLETTNNATIYYTTNGSTPTTASAVYSAPISVSGSLVLKYFAKDSSGNSEPVRTSSYSVVASSQPGGSYSGVKTGTRFDVLRSEGGKPFTTVASGTTGTSFTDSSTLKPNTIYRYAVTSDSDPSQTVFMTVRTPLYNGWNIVAVPYSTGGIAPANFFSGPVGTIFEWVASGASAEDSATVFGSYVGVQSLTPGKGYFAKVANSGTMLRFAGAPGPASATVTLRPGWNMISSPQTVNRTDIGSNWLLDGRPLSEAIVDDLVGGSVYWWNGIAYDSWSILGQNPQIEPWKGYWLLNLHNTNLTLTIQ